MANSPKQHAKPATTRKNANPEAGLGTYDIGLLFAVFFLVGIGLVMVYSASFDMLKSYGDRGDTFRRSVNAITEQPSGK